MTYREVYESTSNRDKSFLDLALKVAEMSVCKQRHGCVITRGGSVLALGFNKIRNDPRFVQYREQGRGTIFSTHAEIDALSRVKNPAGCTVYVARLTKANESGLSRPCFRCFKALTEANVKVVCFT